MLGPIQDDPGGNYWVERGMVYYTFCVKKA